MRQEISGDPIGSLVGHFAYDVASQRWVWSAELYRIYGFEPREVVPTDELLRAHVHPEDVDAAMPPGAELVRRDKPFRFHFRIIDAGQSVRRLLALGLVTGRDGDTSPGRLLGHVVDLTAAFRLENTSAVDDAVADFRENRAVIEQAKGVLMQMFSLSDEEAFLAIRRVSQDANLRVRTVSRRLAAAATARETRGLGHDDLDGSGDPGAGAAAVLHGLVVGHPSAPSPDDGA